MAAEIGETRIGGFHGTCFRCDGIGHYADDTACPWLIKAASKRDHEKRIGQLIERWEDWRITLRQKREYIKHENKLWYGGKVPPQLA